MVFNGTNTFLDNRSSPGRLDLEPEAIHVVNSTVAFQGQVDFIGNSASFGGTSDVSLCPFPHLSLLPSLPPLMPGTVHQKICRVLRLSSHTVLTGC